MIILWNKHLAGGVGANQGGVSVSYHCLLWHHKGLLPSIADFFSITFSELTFQISDEFMDKLQIHYYEEKGLVSLKPKYSQPASYFCHIRSASKHDVETRETPIWPSPHALFHTATAWVHRNGKKCCRRLTGVASLVHHQHIGANANYPTDIALELPVGQPDTAGRGEGLGFGARLWAVHLGPRGIDHAQVFRALLLLAIHVTGQPILLITASLNFNVTGWKRGQG